MACCGEWFTSSTFNDSPSIRFVFIFSNDRAGRGVPIAFALTTRRDSAMYTKFLSVLKKSTHSEWNPEGSMSDFELAIWEGITSTFPNCFPMGCLFHMKQAVQRWMKGLLLF